MANKVHASGTIIENENGEILLLHREVKWPEGGKWGLVGGEIRDDEDMREAAIKKIKAEIGIDFNSEDINHLNTFHWNREDLDITFEVFKIPVRMDQVEIHLDRVGSSEFKWVNPLLAYQEMDLMEGMYPILESVYRVKEGD